MESLAELPSEERERALSRFHLLEPYLTEQRTLRETAVASEVPFCGLGEVTVAVVQAARESLVIGQA